ncbi:MAG: carboxymuconolactone decarboxylase family protein [Candidatus Methylomirabilales bacterium]
MAFFDIPTDEELSPEVRQMLEDYRRLIGAECAPPSWRALGRSPRIVEARLKAYQNLSHQCRFSWEARNLAVMLIAHTKRCQGCFAASRLQLNKLGFDEATLDGICVNPDTLPLKERDRLFVRYALKIATGSADLQPKDFKEMAEHGFSKEEVQEIIAFTAYWTLNIVLTQSMTAALAEE